jgi:hypothetical protein
MHTRTSSPPVVFDVEPDEMLCELVVDGLVHLVEDEVEQVEARDECQQKVDVAGDRQADVVLGAHGIGGSKDRRASIDIPASEKTALSKRVMYYVRTIGTANV